MYTLAKFLAILESAIASDMTGSAEADMFDDVEIPSQSLSLSRSVSSLPPGLDLTRLSLFANQDVNHKVVQAEGAARDDLEDEVIVDVGLDAPSLPCPCAPIPRYLINEDSNDYDGIKLGGVVEYDISTGTHVGVVTGYHFVSFKFTVVSVKEDGEYSKVRLCRKDLKLA